MEKEELYKQRHIRWQKQSIEQLSVANNFLLVISTGLLAYSFDKKIFAGIEPSLCNIDWTLTMYMFSLGVMTLAIITGILVLIARLYDFKLTRHITLVRQRFYIANKDNTPVPTLSHSEFETPNYWQRLGAIVHIIFCRIVFLTQEETKAKKGSFEDKKFEGLRELSFRLGVISWKWTKLQGIYFLMGIILYLIFIPKL